MISKKRKRVTLDVCYWTPGQIGTFYPGTRVEATVDEVFYDGGMGDVMSRYEIIQYHWETYHFALRFPRLAGFWALLRSKLSPKRPVARLLQRTAP